MEFGEDRLRNVVKCISNYASEEICKGVIKEVYKFTNTIDLLDDLTLLVLKVMQ
ncbi:MAG: hypothetical protein ACUVQ1_07095 [Candidatus Kapaibacteriales bacterium]